MSNTWFRMYAEFSTDPKIQMMSEAYQRRFVMLLCMRCNGDATLHDDAAAFQLRISQQEWADTKAVFIEKNLIDHDNNLIAWDRRQFISDKSTNRSRLCRERKKQSQRCATDGKKHNATKCNVAATPPDTDSDTDSDTERSSAARDNSERDCWPTDQPDGKKIGEARQIIEALDQSIVKHFGAHRARPAPSSTDFVTAKSWVDAGASVVACASVIDGVVARQAAKGKPTPNCLSYFENSMRDALARPKIETPDMRPAEEIPLKLDPAIVKILRSNPITASAVRQWFDDCIIDTCAGRIVATTQFKADFIEQKFGPTLRALFGGNIQITTIQGAA